MSVQRKYQRSILFKLTPKILPESLVQDCNFRSRYKIMNHCFILDTTTDHSYIVQLYGLITNFTFSLITSHDLHFEVTTDHNRMILSPIMDHNKTLYYPKTQLPYILVYKSNFLDVKMGSKNRPRLIFGRT